MKVTAFSLIIGRGHPFSNFSGQCCFPNYHFVLKEKALPPCESQGLVTSFFRDTCPLLQFLNDLSQGTEYIDTELERGRRSVKLCEAEMGVVAWGRGLG